jgi:hypothetical protein
MFSHQRQVNVPSFRGCGCLVWGSKREERSLTAKLHTRVPFFRQVAPTINRIRLTKYGLFAKILHQSLESG